MQNRTLKFVTLSLYLIQALIIFYVSFHFHIIEDWAGDNPELDSYAAQIHSMMSLNVPADPFRPAGYVLFSTLISFFTSDAFLAGKIVSFASSIIFFVALGSISRNLFDRKVEIGVLLFFLGASCLVIPGARVASDIFFWALLAVSVNVFILLIKSRNNRERSVRYLIFAGLALGAAIGTRYTGVFLVIPLLGIGILVYIDKMASEIKHEFWKNHFIEDAKNLGVLFAAAVLGYAPAALVNLYAWNKVYYSENWRNILFMFLDYKKDIGMATPADINTFAFQSANIEDYKQTVFSDLSLLFAKTAHQLKNYLVYVNESFSLDRVVSYVGIIIGTWYLVFLILSNRKKLSDVLVHVFILLTVTSFIFLTAATFHFGNSRFVLLPTALIVIYIFGYLSTLSKWTSLIVIAFILTMQIGFKFNALKEYLLMHQTSNLAALIDIRRISEMKKITPKIIGTNIFLDAKTSMSYTAYVPMKILSAKDSSELYCNGLREKIQALKPNFVLFGSISSYGMQTPNCSYLFDNNHWDRSEYSGWNESTTVFIEKTYVPEV